MEKLVSRVVDLADGGAIDFDHRAVEEIGGVGLNRFAPHAAVDGEVVGGAASVDDLEQIEDEPLALRAHVLHGNHVVAADDLAEQWSDVPIVQFPAVQGAEVRRGDAYRRLLFRSHLGSGVRRS